MSPATFSLTQLSTRRSPSRTSSTTNTSLLACWGPQTTPVDGLRHSTTLLASFAGFNRFVQFRAFREFFFYAIFTLTYFTVVLMQLDVKVGYVKTDPQFASNPSPADGVKEADGSADSLENCGMFLGGRARAP